MKGRDFIKTVLIVTGKLLLAMFMIFLLIGFFVLLDFVNTLITKNNADFFANSPYLQMAAFVAGTLIMYAIFDRKKGWALGLRQTGWLKLSWQGMLLGIATISLVSLGILAAGGVRVLSISFDADVRLELMSSFILFACVAFNEELFARGYVQGLLRHHYGVKTAVIVSSLLFALLHGFNPGMWDSPLPILNLFLAGATLAICREISGGLWLPIGFHLTWNYFQGNVYGFQVSGNEMHSVLSLRRTGSDMWSGGAFGAEGSLVAVVVLLVCCYVLYRRRRMFSPTAPFIVEKEA